MTGEEPSDDDSSLHEESGTETTEADTESRLTVESEPVPQTAKPSEFLNIPSADSVSLTPGRSKAANVAAMRGLAVKTDRRRSRMMGLPVSPRPEHSFNPSTPTFAAPGETQALVVPGEM